ncbi:MAG: hypothetical protein ACT4OO_01755 [Nitrospiraceae bacterium]
MYTGEKRIFIARVFAGVAFFSGILGLLAGVLDRTWELGSVGWFAMGSLMALMAVFLLLDGAIAFGKGR